MKNKATKIAMMIEKECCRDSLSGLCEYWGVTTDDFEKFIKAAIENYKEDDA